MSSLEQEQQQQAGEVHRFSKVEIMASAKTKESRYALDDMLWQS